jgi:hypothetical protein
MSPYSSRASTVATDPQVLLGILYFELKIINFVFTKRIITR